MLWNLLSINIPWMNMEVRETSIVYKQTSVFSGIYRKHMFKFCGSCVIKTSVG